MAGKRDDHRGPGVVRCRRLPQGHLRSEMGAGSSGTPNPSLAGLPARSRKVPASRPWACSPSSPSDNGRQSCAECLQSKAGALRVTRSSREAPCCWAWRPPWLPRPPHHSLRHAGSWPSLPSPGETPPVTGTGHPRHCGHLLRLRRAGTWPFLCSGCTRCRPAP